MKVGSVHLRGGDGAGWTLEIGLVGGWRWGVRVLEKALVGHWRCAWLEDGDGVDGNWRGGWLSVENGAVWRLGMGVDERWR